MSVFASFHEQQMINMRINEHMQETRAAKIDAMANDLYNEKLQALPNGDGSGTEYRSRPGYNIWSALDDLDQIDLIPVARAIIDNDAAEVGSIIINLITAHLRKIAQQEADYYDDENHLRSY